MRAPFAAALALLCGCAAPYFSGQNGRVTPRGSVRASLATGYNFASTAADVVRDAEDLVDGVGRVPCPTADEPGRRCFRAEDLEPVADAAFRLALVSPLAAHSELAARYGVGDGLDVGLHLSPGALRLDLGVQLFGPVDPEAPGDAGALFVGLSRRSSGAVGDVLAILDGEARVVDLDLAFVAGRQLRQVAHLYAGARYLVSRWSLDVSPDLPVSYGGLAVDDALLGTDGSGLVHQTGLLGGGALGFRRVFVGVELSTVWYRGEARVLSRARLLEGIAVMPSVYVTGTW